MFIPNDNNLFDTEDMKCLVVHVQDTNVGNVIKKFSNRANHGLTKYGVTTERDDLNLFDWLEHLQDELMDATIYVERLKRDIMNATL